VECKQLLNELKITIENYKLQGSSPSQHELSRFKASLASQYAINTIEELIFTNEELDDAKKLDYLKNAERAFVNSINFYNQAGLMCACEKEKIMHCQNILNSFIKKFEVSIKAKKYQIKKKEPSKTPKTSPIKSTIVSKDLRVYQPILSDRIISMMFNTSFVGENCKIGDNQKICYSLK
jgi:hypothetical protein